MFNDLNYWAILVSGLAYWIIGGIWYAAIFSKQYQAALNFDEETQKQGVKDFPKALVAHFVSGVITSFFLASVAQAMGLTSFGGGVIFGVFAWLAFALTLNLNYLMFERRPKALFMINNGFFLVAFAVMGGIVAVWQ